jgi:GTP-binding protein|tara:strand:- start:21 stop:611 length:591 start_codon:yes stop_codon:yes gene_type:complete
MNFKQTHFATSAATLKDCPADSRAEVAFAGRSNAGKSSAINTITTQSRLARISKTPGRTQLINFFEVTALHYIADLPGYGYAKVPLKIKNKWQLELERYLRQRESLVGLILLSDIRHDMKDFDLMMIDWAVHSNLPLHLLLTKSDKLKRGPAQNALLKAQKALEKHKNITIQIFSSVKKTGVEEVREVLKRWLMKK